MSREVLENSNTFYAEVASGEDIERCYASKVQGQSRANIHYRRMTCNQLLCSVVGSLKKGRRAKHLNCERNCQWNPVGHVQKARGWRRVLWSHMALLRIVGDCRQNLKLLSFCERALSMLCTFGVSESVFEWRHFIYFIDSVDCGLFCVFFVFHSRSILNCGVSEVYVVGRGLRGWISCCLDAKCFTASRQGHRRTVWNIEEEPSRETGHIMPWSMIPWWFYDDPCQGVAKSGRLEFLKSHQLVERRSPKPQWCCVPGSWLQWWEHQAAQLRWMPRLRQGDGRNKGHTDSERGET